MLDGPAEGQFHTSRQDQPEVLVNIVGLISCLGPWRPLVSRW